MRSYAGLVAFVIACGLVLLFVAGARSAPIRKAHPSHRIGKVWVCPELPNGRVITTACMLWVP